jgi:hypothetical protein
MGGWMDACMHAWMDELAMGGWMVDRLVALSFHVFEVRNSIKIPLSSAFESITSSRANQDFYSPQLPQTHPPGDRAEKHSPFPGVQA